MLWGVGLDANIVTASLKAVISAVNRAGGAVRAAADDLSDPMLRLTCSERIGQFFLESDGGRDRLEYTEYGSGDDWVVLLHGLLMPRRMQQPLARALAAQGLHVVTLDLLGHGRSDRPADPLVYSMTSFGEQVVALLDHLGRGAGRHRRHVAGRQRLPRGGGRSRPSGSRA